MEDEDPTPDTLEFPPEPPPVELSDEDIVEIEKQWERIDARLAQRPR